MRGQGATDTDNRLIELTVNVRESLRLNSVKFLNGSTYSGDWLGGKRHGHGTLIWADGSRYDGEWRDNYCWDSEDWPTVTVKPTRESLFATSARERAT